jgi:succinoglycan biosynthesis protein ExoA
MESRPRVCLVMCFRNEAAHLPAVLATLAAQTIGHERLHLIAVDDGSNDGSGAIVEDWLARGDIGGRVMRAEFGSIPHALNLALTAIASKDYVVRLDAHTLYEPKYVERMLNAFAALGPDAWCVGTSEVPGPATSFGKALHASLFTNPMGLGPADYRSKGARIVKSVYLGAWRPGVLQRLGGYDPRWSANEDAELAERIRRAGGQVVRIDARAEKIMTRGALSALRQWTRYGFWRAQTLKYHRSALGLRHVAPPLALLVALSLLISPARAWLVPAYLAYAMAVIALRARNEAPLVTLATIFYFPLLHSGYALGILTGLLVNPIKRRSLRHERTSEVIDRGDSSGRRKMVRTE